jgi:hypothetical protein
MMIKLRCALTRTVGLLSVGVLLAACQAIPVPGPTQSPLATPKESTVSVTEAAPATQVAPQPEVVPTPGAEYGVVTGTVMTSETTQPTSEVVMFLGEMHGREDGFPIVAVDRQLSPRAVPASTTGRFVFVDVPPGEYGVIYWDPDASFLVERPDKAGESLIITVESGSAQDVGVLQVPPH